MSIRDLESLARIVQILTPQTVSNSDDQSGTEADVGNAKQGTLIVSIEKGTTGVTDVGIYSSESATVVESSTTRLTINQDAANSTGTVTVTDNEFDLGTTGIYSFDVKDVKRYINVEYDGDDSDSIISIVFIAQVQSEAPYTSAQSAY